MLGQDEGEEVGRQIHGEVAAAAHRLALGFDPGNQPKAPAPRGDTCQDGEAVP